MTPSMLCHPQHNCTASVHTSLTDHVDDSPSTTETENCSATKNRSRLCTHRLMAVTILKPLNLPYYFWRFLYPLYNTQRPAATTSSCKNIRDEELSTTQHIIGWTSERGKIGWYSTKTKHIFSKLFIQSTDWRLFRWEFQTFYCKIIRMETGQDFPLLDANNM